MPTILSFLFLFACLIYLFWGTYVIKLNPQSKINKMFLCICILLSIWTFGFSMAISVKEPNISLMWYRFAAIGWSFIFSINLHFSLLLTGKKEYLGKKSILLLIYIPALITVIAFSISTTLTRLQYNIHITDFGWSNNLTNNICRLFFHSYYISFSIVSFMLINKWMTKLKDKEIKRQASILVLSMMICFILGTLTDVILSTYGLRSFPQITPLFMLFPAWAIYHSARYYDLTEHKIKEEDEIIVTEKEQESIFYNLAIAYCVGGIIAFLAEYMSRRGDLQFALIKAGFIISVGMSIYIAQKIKNEYVKDLLTITILLISIPVISIQFLSHSTITVWALPIIIIISSLLFSKKTLLISVTIVAIISQRLVWMLRPESLVKIGKYDYIARIGMFITAYFIGSYVNKIYVSKIKENTYQIQFQKMNSDTSYDFITINKENFNDKINLMLERMGKFFKVDRTYLFIIDYEKGLVKYSNEWCNKGISPKKYGSGDIPIEEFAWWINEFKDKETIYIEDIDYMTNEMMGNFEDLIRKNIKSFISVPVVGEGKIQGIIGMDSVKTRKKWTDENIKLLNIMGNLVAGGLLQIKLDKEIEYMAYYDFLTNLPNRFLFEHKVSDAIKRAKKNDENIGVMFIDLDNFKSINDTMGHSSGDYILKEVAKTFEKNLRQEDTVARFAGDEFIFLFSDINDINDIKKLAKNTMDTFLTPFTINDQEVFITGSGGIAIYPQDGTNAEALIKNADTAMHRAKSLGKNQYSVCTFEMKDEVIKNMRLSNDLYRAIERDELVVYYQPQVDLNTGKISGFEALVRWMHPKLGMLPPSVFIPLAEKNNLINDIGEWVLRTASRQNKIWQEKGYGHLSMAVNLSAVQFINPNLASNVEDILAETGLDPKYLELEITESIAIRGTNNAIGTLNELRRSGISIAIDDFGTEYSSLSRLKSLPIDRLKIDMQFIQGIDHDEKDQAITMVIINLAKNLGLNVLAEGVETEPQLTFLYKKMCDYVQGYYYYKPMPADQIEDILKSLN